MVDFVKIALRNAEKSALEKNELLEFIGTHSTKTGEVKNKMVAEYKGLKFIVYENGYTLIQGSLHKYMNSGKHNFNDFSFMQLKEVLIDISNKFNFDLEDCIIRNIEFGVNIKPPLSTNEIINNLLIHKNKRFKDVSLSGGNYKQAGHTQYFVKIYNKGLQYKLKYELMRIELKFFKMQKLNDIGIYTLKDLTAEAWIKPVGKLLLNEWSNTILYDQTIKKTGLNSLIKNKKIHQWSNANYWLNLTKQEKCRQLKKYSTFVSKYSNNIQKILSDSINKKWNYLNEKS